jgi:hypothetical protein
VVTYIFCRALKDIEPDLPVKDSGKDASNPRADKPKSPSPTKSAPKTVKSPATEGAPKSVKPPSPRVVERTPEMTKSPSQS